MSAALTRTPRPDLAPDAVELVINCPHFTTGAFLVGLPEEEETLVLAVLLARHDQEGRCRCTAPLWVRVRALAGRN